MPYTINGIGTSVCGGRGNIGWGSYDAMEWLVVVFMPVIPIKAVHTFDWQGQQYRMIPIRWSFDLMARTFFSRWLWGLGLIGIILFIVGFAEAGQGGIGFFLAGGLLVLLAVAIGVILHLSDQRNKNIRLVLGPITIGNCDPVNLPQDLLDGMAADTQLAYGTSSYAKAAQKLLGEGSFARAMWCARMTTALEDAPGGESLTDEILSDPRVQTAIDRVRRSSSHWQSLMMSPQEIEQASRTQEVEDLPIIEDLPEQPMRVKDDRIRGE